VVARSEAKVCRRSLAGAVGSNPVGGTDVCRVCVCVLLCCQVEVSASGRMFVCVIVMRCNYNPYTYYEHVEVRPRKRDRKKEVVSLSTSYLRSLKYRTVRQDILQYSSNFLLLYVTYFIK